MTRLLSHCPKVFGVCSPPFDDGLDVDLDSFRNEVAAFVADGCDGLVALGVFGEAASLTADEADSVANAVSSCTDLPFVLGLSERDPDGVVEQARRLLDATSRPPVALMAQISDPDPVAAVLTAHREGGFEAAREVWAPWLPLANFEGQLRGGLSIRKELLRRRG